MLTLWDNEILCDNEYGCLLLLFNGTIQENSISKIYIMKIWIDYPFAESNKAVIEGEVKNIQI